MVNSGLHITVADILLKITDTKKSRYSDLLVGMSKIAKSNREAASLYIAKAMDRTVNEQMGSTFTAYKNKSYQGVDKVLSAQI